MSLFMLTWLVYMIATDGWDLFQTGWFMALTMMLGSFIAGASSEGGGAVAFPAMTLLYGITTDVARNFSLAIQSVGMTSAAYLILRRRFPIAVRYLVWAGLGGIPGIIVGALYVAPCLGGAYVKMLFVSFWLSFGIVLFYINVLKKRLVRDRLPTLVLSEKLLLLLVGALGGLLSALLGSGIDIVTFAYVTMRYDLSEKVATPTSVILMAFNSVIGFMLHLFVLRDFGPQEFDYFLVCLPIVVIGAPLGAWFINQRTRTFVTSLLYWIILVQFAVAVLIVQPRGLLLGFSFAVFLLGLGLFFGLSKIMPSKCS